MAGGESPTGTAPVLQSAPIVVVPRRIWTTLIVAIIFGGFLLFVAQAFATSKNIRWGEVLRYLTSPTILDGLGVTIELTVLAMIVGLGLGAGAGAMRLSSNPLVRAISGAYIWLFRGTPLLVQIILWFNLALVFPRIGFGSISVSTNDVMSSFVAGMLALSLNEGAYMAEIVRGGILSVDRGQTEAALAQGLTRLQTLRRIVLPQALRFIIPAAGNQTIMMLKATSLVSVIAAQDLLTQAQAIFTRTYLVIELLFVATIWYLILTTVATIGQGYLERRLGDDPREAGGIRQLAARLLRRVGRRM